MSYIWLPLFILFVMLILIHVNTDPEEVAVRQPRRSRSTGRRVGKTLGRNVAKHTKWAAPGMKRPVRRKP